MVVLKQTAPAVDTHHAVRPTLCCHNQCSESKRVVRRVPSHHHTYEKQSSFKFITKIHKIHQFLHTSSIITKTRSHQAFHLTENSVSNTMISQIHSLMPWTVLKFNSDFLLFLNKKQECIPVGCVPSARYRTGVSLTTTPPDRDPSPETPLDKDPSWTETPPQTETPLDRDPPWTKIPPGQRPSLDRDPPRTETPQTETPLVMWPVVHAGTETPLWTESQTTVKT